MCEVQNPEIFQLFFYCLGISDMHTMCFSEIYSPTFCYNFLPLSSQFHVLHFESPLSHLLLSEYACVQNLYQSMCGLTGTTSFQKIGSFSFKQSSVDTSFSARGLALQVFSLSCWDLDQFDLVQILCMKSLPL